MEGIKHDQGKPRMDLLPMDALLEIAKVFGFGACKYGDRNWEKGLDVQRLRAAQPEEVAVRVPLELLWDSESLATVKKDILGRLGCLACTSGFDIRWKGIREFVVNPALEVREINEFG